MNLKPKRSEEPEVNLTPLIDVVFLMLIFFMVSTTFLKEADLQIALPEASAEPQPVSQQMLELVIDSDGQYFLDGNKLLNTQSDTVRMALERARQADDERPLVVRADARTPHQSVVTALDAAGQAGFARVSVATVPNEQ